MVEPSYTDLVAHHCSADALRHMMPALLPHEDMAKRHTPSITSMASMVLPFMGRGKAEADKGAEAKGECHPGPHARPHLASPATRHALPVEEPYPSNSPSPPPRPVWMRS